MKKRLILTLSILICSNSTTTCKVVFFNLNTLLKTSQSTFAKNIGSQVGYWTLLKYFGGNITSCDQSVLIGKLFDALRRWSPQDGTTYPIEQYQGKNLPPLLLAWHCGKLPCGDLLKEAYATLDKNAEITPEDRTIYKAIIKNMLDPVIFAATQSYISGGIEHIKAARKAGHSAYLIANCHPETFVELQKKFPELFNLFAKDKIIISGNCHELIPTTQWCSRFCDQSNILPSDCCLIDAEEYHRNAATPLHMIFSNHASQLSFQ